jgi:tetratricopeptide (TPR) repeat protein
MRLAIIAAGLLTLAAATPAATAQETYAQTRALTLFNQLSSESSCEEALPAARAFWPSQDFQQLGQQDRVAFLSAVAQCAWTMQDGQAAIDAANAAHDLDGDGVDKFRIMLGLAFDNDALATQAFFDLAQSSPKDFSTLDSSNAWAVLRAAEHMQGGDAVVLRMHEMLLTAHYAPGDGAPDDFFRIDHARLLMTRGQADRARERLQGVIDPTAITMIRIDHLYDPLRTDPAFERRLDAGAAAQETITRARRLVAEQPRHLAAVVGLVRALRDVGRSQEALAEIDRVLPAAQAPPPADNYDDLQDQLNWLLNAKADLLYDLGRNDEARTMFSASMTVNLKGEVNANQAIAFAAMLNAEGRGADALQVLHTVSRLSIYGETLEQSERACAADQTHDQHTRDEALAALRAHEADNPGALSHALLCVNDLNGAAVLMIRRLNNPIEREQALLALQRYHRIPTRRMPQEVVELQRLAQVRDRPDIQAAVARVGRIEDSPLYAY